MSTSHPEPTLTPEDLLFVAFNGRVFGISRYDGSIIWQWNSARSSFVTLLPDGDLLFVSANGYTWALNPATGHPLWHQPFKGEGTGVPSLATMQAGATSPSAAAQEAANEAARRAAAS